MFTESHNGLPVLTCDPVDRLIQRLVVSQYDEEDGWQPSMVECSEIHELLVDTLLWAEHGIAVPA